MLGSGFDGRECQFGMINLDGFLPIAEVLCIAPPAVFSIGFALNSTIFGSQKWFEASLVNRFFVWNLFLLVGAVAIGALIRHRQWKRIYRDSAPNSGGDVSFNLVERVGKLEEDLQSSVTIIKVLSRQLEKLGIRFRVTRKALKEPIAEVNSLFFQSANFHLCSCVKPFMFLVLVGFLKEAGIGFLTFLIFTNEVILFVFIDVFIF